MDRDCAHVLCLSGEFTGNEGEEVLVLVVQHLFASLLHLVVELDGVKSENFVVAFSNLFGVLQLCALLMQLNISKTDDPPPEHVLVASVQLLSEVVEDGA